MRKNVNGFSIIELLVVITIIALIVGILLPVLSSSRKASRMMVSNTQMRGVIQGFNVFAQDNNSWYPGIDGNTGHYIVTPFNFINFFKGKAYTINLDNFNPNQVELAICLNFGLFGPQYPVSPGEINPNVTPAPPSAPGDETKLNQNGPNSSYAMLRVDNRYGTNERDKGRLAECRNNMTSDAVIFSDRGMGTKDADGHEYLNTTSIWTNSTQSATSNPRKWIGGVAFGDGHVDTYQSSVMPTTSYNKVRNKNDNIFVGTDGSQDDSNAYMVYGNFKNIPGILNP